MVEPTDAIMPILQRIQADIVGVKDDIADMRRVQDEHTRRLGEIGEVLSQHTRQLSEMNGYMSFSLSIISRHSGENEAVRGELDAIKRRLARLEGQIQPS
jgi:hypothetical protein